MSTSLQLFVIAIGGALGAMSRFGIAELSKRWYGGPFPLGTLIANLIGCFLIGMMLGSGVGEKYAAVKLGVGVGFLGALTTFSTFKAETVTHIDDGNWLIAVGNIAISVIAGLALVVGGIAIGKKYFG